MPTTSNSLHVEIALSSTHDTINGETVPPLPTPGTTFSGTKAVLGMFGMGLLLSVAMLAYWYVNLSEFFPLQKALAKEFDKCTPRIDAGRRKDEPILLRVMLQVPEQPQSGNPRTERIVARTLELTREHVKLERYGTLQIFLVYREPEKKPYSLRYEYAISELLQGKSSPKIVENP